MTAPTPPDAYAGPGGRAARCVELSEDERVIDLWWLEPPGGSPELLYTLTLQRSPNAPGVYMALVATQDMESVRRAHYQTRASLGPEYTGDQIPADVVDRLLPRMVVNVEALFMAPNAAAARAVVRYMLTAAASGQAALPLVPATDTDRLVWMATAVLAATATGHG